MLFAYSMLPDDVHDHASRIYHISGRQKGGSTTRLHLVLFIFCLEKTASHRPGPLSCSSLTAPVTLLDTSDHVRLLLTNLCISPMADISYCTYLIFQWSWPKYLLPVIYPVSHDFSEMSTSPKWLSFYGKKKGPHEPRVPVSIRKFSLPPHTLMLRSPQALFSCLPSSTLFSSQWAPATQH